MQLPSNHYITPELQPEETGKALSYSARICSRSGGTHLLIIASVLTMALSACGDRNEEALSNSTNNNPGTDLPIVAPPAPSTGSAYSTAPSSANYLRPTIGINTYRFEENGLANGSPFNNSHLLTHEYNTDAIHLNGEIIPVITTTVDGSYTNYHSAALGWWWSVPDSILYGQAIVPDFPATMQAAKSYKIIETGSEISFGTEWYASTTVTFTVESLSTTSPTNNPASGPAALSLNGCIKVNYTVTNSFSDTELATGLITTDGGESVTGTVYVKSGVGKVFDSYNYMVTQYFYVNGVLDDTITVDTNISEWLTSSTSATHAPVINN